ncbi:MAG: hypothetical protein AVDCRST_MAG96-4082 [uncultured Segetibacter sp.]|uniref:Uncharacterized protein n=1 Tax=uncultured Segetibacter sp. TaxID=481133 RepID=A0A6J4U1K5_9BACT|nr:MAG: hypothetical protein AVDCRST_MAG96-4082 [uncultured Segetibacter sp.]
MGAGLTEIASAFLTQPGIAQKITLCEFDFLNILIWLFRHPVIL